MLNDVEEGGPSRVIMHIDFDYFYAQCEELRRPEIKGKPVVVCVYSGRTSDSGVVSTSNYPAREYGVKSGIPIRSAKSKLASVPESVFLPLDMKYYSQKSEAAMSIIQRHADRYEYVGIDECFIDVTETTSLDLAKAEELATTIKHEILNALKLTCSIGVAPNKLLAKIGSDFQKPDGLTLIPPNGASEFLSGMDVRKIPGIGPKTTELLYGLGAKTVGDLAKINLFRLAEEFGKKTAIYLYNSAKGVNSDPVVESDPAKQIGRIITLAHNSTESGDMYKELEGLCHSVHDILSSKNLSFKTIGLQFILSDLDNMSRSKSLKIHSANYEEIYSIAKAILDETMALDEFKSGQKKVRRLGIRLSEFKDSSGQNAITDFF